MKATEIIILAASSLAKLPAKLFGIATPICAGD